MTASDILAWLEINYRRHASAEVSTIPQ